jgi:hypothetical protein
MRSYWPPPTHGRDGPLLLGGVEPWDADTGVFRRPVVSFDVPAPDSALRAGLWRLALGDEAADLGSVADSFKLGPREIERAASSAVLRAELREERPLPSDLDAAARAESSHALGAYAQRLAPAYTWNDIVLPPRALRALHEVCAGMRFRRVVRDDWAQSRSGQRAQCPLFRPQRHR